MGGRRLDAAVFAIYLALLVWAPLPFASNREWAGSLLCLLLAVPAAAWCLLAAAGQAAIGRGVWRVAWPVLLLLVLVQAWVFLQMVPLPPAWLEALSPQASAWQAIAGPMSLSLDPAATRYFLLRGCAATLGFFLAIATVNSPSRMRLFLQVLVFSGTLQAVYGAMMVLTGLEFGFFVEKYSGLGSATGTFVNRNHLAGYLVMCLAAGTGLLLSQLDRHHPGDWRERLERWLRLLLSPKIRLRVYLAVMVVALVLTRSRLGNLAFFTALGVAGVVAVLTGRRFSWRVVVFLGSLLLVDVLILGRWFGLDRLVDRLEQLEGQPVEAVSRYWADRYGLDYLADFPLTGSGGGSFYGIFPNYQGPMLGGYYDHAHNDYLELAAELGLPAVALLGAAVLFSLWSAVGAQRRGTALYRGAGFAATMTVVWALLHSLGDFNLQVPANAVTFCALLGLAAAARGLSPPGGEGGDGNQGLARHRKTVVPAR